ncbi:hypothetical protein BCD49_20260 [Pseudofrankia sp. EUN1h]|nr:hypothetical protein BCD49_20260 [Pseudofrankia sp. EUN1h]
MTNPSATPQWAPPQSPGPDTSAGAGWGVLGKHRNPVAVWLGLPLITLGIYGLVWIYKTNRELSQYDRRINVNPAMSVLACTFGAILLVPPFVAVWRLCTRTAQAQRAAGVPEVSTGLAFLLFLLGFGPLFLQLEINKIWSRYPAAVEGQQVPLAA